MSQSLAFLSNLVLRERLHTYTAAAAANIENDVKIEIVVVGALWQEILFNYSFKSLVRQASVVWKSEPTRRRKKCARSW